MFIGSPALTLASSAVIKERRVFIISSRSQIFPDSSGMDEHSLTELVADVGAKVKRPFRSGSNL